ncbi:MAG: class I SAM-dependent methyltransferase [Chloroflexota bacterium]|nr:MAG: class I SAM-dependent methyltransferase [Chloroflexota bacterium]
MTQELQSHSYDELPYPSLSYAQTHPDRLASMARLLGLDHAPVDRCRVLDVGCAVGGNIIPMAYALPNSEFVGIDYSGRQIEIGLGYVSELGLNNVRLEHADVMAVPEVMGQFDYIIAHGFYSWVPAAVRDRLLAVIRRHLAPKGIAYVSYNTYPGWHMLQVVRDAMLYSARNLSQPAERAAAGRAIVEFLSDAVPAEAGPFGGFLNGYRTALAEKLAEGEDGGDSLLLHDEMGEINQPVYFEQFVDHTAEHGLQYLSEVDLASVMPSKLEPDIAGRLAELAGNSMVAEQYLDFVKFRTFRQTLLCHEEVKINRTLRPTTVGRFRLASSARPVSDEPELGPGAVEKFRGSDGAVFSTDHPLTKAAFLTLIDNRPAAVPFGELLREAAGRVELALDEAAEGEVATLAGNALRALSYSPSLIEFHVYQTPFSLKVSDRPRTTPVVRWQARQGMKATNLRHERVELDAISAILLPMLDGKHDRDVLLASLVTLQKRGRLQLPEKLLEAAGAEEILGKQLDQALRFMARAALLEA